MTRAYSYIGALAIAAMASAVPAAQMQSGASNGDPAAMPNALHSRPEKSGRGSGERGAR